MSMTKDDVTGILTAVHKTMSPITINQTVIRSMSKAGINTSEIKSNEKQIQNQNTEAAEEHYLENNAIFFDDVEDLEQCDPATVKDIQDFLRTGFECRQFLDNFSDISGIDIGDIGESADNLPIPEEAENEPILE